MTADEVDFGTFRMHRRTGRLYRRNGHGPPAPVPLGSRARDLLRLLVDRAGDVVSKSEIMDVVWPGQAVNENNLTVQMSTLRRVLDAGRAEGSYIETVPGRGYRFIEALGRRMEPGDDALIPPRGTIAGSEAAAKPGTRIADRGKAWPWIVAATCAAMISLAAFWTNHWFGRQVPPRFSFAVLPFVDREANPDRRHLADEVTVDLTTDLTQDPQATVASAAAADTYRGRAADPREWAGALNVRYVITGGLRQDGSELSDWTSILLRRESGPSCGLTGPKRQPIGRNRCRSESRLASETICRRLWSRSRAGATCAPRYAGRIRRLLARQRTQAKRS